MWEMDYESAANHWLEKDKESVHMDAAALKERIENFIAGHNTCALATAILIVTWILFSYLRMEMEKLLRACRFRLRKHILIGPRQ